MRVTRFLPLLLLVHAGVSSAVLGGPPEKFNPEDKTVVSRMTSNYMLLDTTLATGTHIRQYVSSQGLVFAVTWSGPFLPELRVLLAKYFDTIEAESARTSRAGRSHIANASSNGVASGQATFTIDSKQSLDNNIRAASVGGTIGRNLSNKDFDWLITENAQAQAHQAMRMHALESS